MHALGEGGYAVCLLLRHWVMCLVSPLVCCALHMHLRDEQERDFFILGKEKAEKAQIFPIMTPEKVCAVCFVCLLCLFVLFFVCSMRVFNVWFEDNTVLSIWFCISHWGRWVLGGGLFFLYKLSVAREIKRVGENFFSYEKTLKLLIYTRQIWWWKISVTLKQRWSSIYHQPHWSG